MPGVRMLRTGTPKLLALGESARRVGIRKVAGSSHASLCRGHSPTSGAGHKGDGRQDECQAGSPEPVARDIKIRLAEPDVGVFKMGDAVPSTANNTLPSTTSLQDSRE